jgi:hypothetical protein
MRKFLLVVLSVLLVIGFSSTTFARHGTVESEYNPGMVTKEGVQIEMSGQVRVRGEYRDNVDDFDDDEGDDDAYFDSRVRLKFKARVTPSTMGVVELETGGDTGDSHTWGTGPSGATGNGGVGIGNRKIGDLAVRQAYIATQMHPFGNQTDHVGLKAGHMLLALGNGLFYDHSKFGDDGVIVWTNIPGTDGEVSFIYSKFEEGDTAESDDVNVYALALEYPANGVNVTGDVTLLDIQDYNGVMAGSPGAHLWNFGLRGDAEVSGINLMGNVEFQAGSADEAAAGDDLDFEGWAVLLGADTMVSDVNVNAEFAYGSGDDDGTDSNEESFITSLGASQHYTYVYEHRTVSAAFDTSTGIANTWYVKVGASAKPMPDVKVIADVYYLQASEDVAINGGSEDSGLGWEIDGKLEYQIDKNLLYFVEGGYFFVGDAYDFPTEDGDNAYAVRNGVVLKF